MSADKATVEKIIIHALLKHSNDFAESLSHIISEPDVYKDAKELEAALDKHYMQEFLEIIGEDDRVHCAVCGSEALPKSICSSGVCLVASARNELRAELRDAVTRKWGK